MRLFLQELKKLLRPQYVAAFLVLLSILCGYFIIPNFYYCYQDAHQKQPQLNTPEAVIYDSYELLFTDMLLEEYGETIEKSELPHFREQTERFLAQVREVVENDAHLQDAHMILNGDYQLIPDPNDDTIAEEEVPASMNDPYVHACVFGIVQLPGTDYPLGFAHEMQTLLAGLEDISAKEEGDPVLYRVTSPLFIREMGNTMLPVLFTSLCSILLLVPYGILENRRHTLPMLYATRTGRQITRKRLGIALVCVLCFVAAGAALAIFQFTAWDLDSYYPTTVDDGIYEATGFSLASRGHMEGSWTGEPVSYGGSTFLGLFFQLLLFSIVSGIICPMLAALISFQLRNRITASIVSLLPALMELGLFFLYVSRPVGGNGIFSSGRLHFLFPGEPWAVLAGMTLLLTTAVAAHLIHMRRCEIR